MELTSRGNIRLGIQGRVRSKMQRTCCSAWANIVCELLLYQSSTEMPAVNCTAPCVIDTDAVSFWAAGKAVPCFPSHPTVPWHQNCYIFLQWNVSPHQLGDQWMNCLFSVFLCITSCTDVLATSSST